jgi:hypothetical protein
LAALLGTGRAVRNLRLPAKAEKPFGCYEALDYTIKPFER